MTTKFCCEVMSELMSLKSGTINTFFVGMNDLGVLYFDSMPEGLIGSPERVLNWGKFACRNDSVSESEANN